MAKTSPYEPSSRSPEAAGANRRWRGALISEVEPGSPADREGLEPGMVVTHVNGEELRDMIVWQWEADGPYATLEGIAYPDTPEAFEFECELERSFGEDWGVTFEGAVFDGMRLCRNDCLFCFMKMLPKGMRKTLYLRDDDYRLSFLQGNFVTLTNVSDADVERIVSQALSPLNVSLHAVSPDVRARLMGKNAARGLEAVDALLEGGVELHAQIVLVPGENDGAELRRTLDFVEARPGITTLGIVPLGFTRFQQRFSASFNEPERAQAVINLVAPYQQRSRETGGTTRFQLADEFYLAAGVEPPAADDYDGYPQYHDGIGMVRSFLDEAADLLGDPEAQRTMAAWGRRLEASGARLLVLSGTAAAPVMERFLQATPLAAAAHAQPIDNRYFGGNVNVTGLLTRSDVAAQLPDDLTGTVVVVPDLMLNADGLTLDGVSGKDLCTELAGRGGRAVVAQTTPRGLAACMGEL